MYFTGFIAKGFKRDAFVDASGRSTADQWDLQHIGWRADWKPNERDTFSAQGDVFSGGAGTTFRIPTFAEPFVRTFNDNTRLGGGNFLSHWQRVFSASSDLRLQFYYDRNEGEDGVIEIQTDVFDIDFQHRFAPSTRQEIVWGAGYRRYQDETAGSFKLSYLPAARNTDLFSAFFHDEIALVEKRLRLALGAKFEHKDTGRPLRSAPAYR